MPRASSRRARLRARRPRHLRIPPSLPILGPKPGALLLGAAQQKKAVARWGLHGVSMALCCALMTLLGGCAARRPVSSQPPSQPAAASAETIDAAKRSTDVPEPTAGPAPPVAPNVRQPAANTMPSSSYSEEGNASWYGNPFHGRRSSNGSLRHEQIHG